MKINKITYNQTTFQGSHEYKKPNFLEKFYDNTKNSADMTDAILVPRTIFKGYLGIMSGTTLITLGSVLNKYSKLSKSLTITGLLASLYGTWAFVRPYIIKDAKGVVTAENLKA